jgi:hypothetical protein
MVREDGIRMALSRCPVIRFPYSEERGGIKRFGEGEKRSRWQEDKPRSGLGEGGDEKALAVILGVGFGDFL